MVITKGNTALFKIKYYDNNETPFIIPQDAIIKFTVKDKIDGTKKLEKELSIADYDEQNECYNLVLLPSDTSSIQLNGKDTIDFYYDFELRYIQDNTQVIKTMDKGRFVVTYKITD